MDVEKVNKLTTSPRAVAERVASGILRGRWLVLFLLDVAVRRIALDIRAMARRVVSFVWRPLAERKADKNLERLRLTQKKLREQLSPSDEALASKRYKADEAFSGDLPKAQVPLQSDVTTEKPPEKPETVKKDTEEDQSHIQQLLRVKRKVTEKRKDKIDNNE